MFRVQIFNLRYHNIILEHCNKCLLIVNSRVVSVLSTQIVNNKNIIIHDFKKILDNLIIFYNFLSFKANIKPEGKEKKKMGKMHRDLEITISTNFKKLTLIRPLGQISNGLTVLHSRVGNNKHGNSSS